MDREIYRSVPFRFVVSKANTDVCKLEQLTNLFPDVKELIELGMSTDLFTKKITEESI